MSSIAGFFYPNTTYTPNSSYCLETIRAMSKALRHRGPDHTGFAFCAHGAFSQNELSCSHICLQIPHETQPVTRKIHEDTYILLYDGAITNLPELRSSLNRDSAQTEGLSQEELLLRAFLKYGPEFAKRLTGGFALAILDEKRGQLFLFRDPLGLRPLFYTVSNSNIIFASEPKGLFAHPEVTPELDLDGLNEVFSMGPARTPGSGVFHNIQEVKPGHYLSFGKQKLCDVRYYQFAPAAHTDSYADTLAHIRELLERSFEASFETRDEPAALLSGGLDSSVVTAALLKNRGENTEPLKTFSFDFCGSRSHFRANSFQPALDAPYVQQMANALRTDHMTLVCGNEEQYRYLEKSVDAHDLPAMADVDSSLLYFCEKVAAHNRIVFTGECADELFCGYPWYHDPQMYQAQMFPWSRDFAPRKALLSDSFLSRLHMEEYAEAQYDAACRELPVDELEPEDLQLHQKTFYLTVRFFMQTLINRTDRAAAANSMDARVPFADLRLAEYLLSVPYDYKTKDGEVKHLLREFARGMIPEEVRTRKKSPYPKTYDPGYEALLIGGMMKVLSDPNSPILEFLDREKVISFCRSNKDPGKPWYGQLMAGPQLLAYYLQINYWMEKYQIRLL